MYEREPRKATDRYAVAVKKDGTVIADMSIHSLRKVMVQNKSSLIS